MGFYDKMKKYKYKGENAEETMIWEVEEAIKMVHPEGSVSYILVKEYLEKKRELME